MQPIPLEAFYSGLGLHVDPVLAVQVFKNRSFMGGLSPSSLWTRSHPVVVMLFVFGSWWVLWWWVSDGIGGGIWVCLRDLGAPSSRRSFQGSKGRWRAESLGRCIGGFVFGLAPAGILLWRGSLPDLSHGGERCLWFLYSFIKLWQLALATILTWSETV